jgi:serine/threonine protein kinase
MFQIIENDGPPIPEGLSDSLVAFLKDCFHETPAQRPSAKELSQHEWLTRNCALNKVGSTVTEMMRSHRLVILRFSEMN